MVFTCRRRPLGRLTERTDSYMVHRTAKWSNGFKGLASWLYPQGRS
jgi:hypothetical protein